MVVDPRQHYQGHCVFSSDYEPAKGAVCDGLSRPSPSNRPKRSSSSIASLLGERSGIGKKAQVWRFQS